MERAERRNRTDLVIARRLALHRRYGQADMKPHQLHKHDTMGHCSHRSCSICSLERAWKRQEKKRERAQLKRAERDGDR